MLNLKYVFFIVALLCFAPTFQSCEIHNEEITRVEVGEELRMLLIQYRDEGRLEYQRLEELLLSAEIDREAKLQIMLNVFNGRFDAAMECLQEIKNNTALIPFIRDVVVAMRNDLGEFRIEAIALLIEIRGQNTALQGSIDSGIAQVLASNLQILGETTQGNAFMMQVIGMLQAQGLTLNTIMQNSNLALSELAVIRQFVILNNTGINDANTTLATLDLQMGMHMADFNTFQLNYAGNWQQMTGWFGTIISNGNLANSGIANLEGIILQNFATSFANDQAILLGQQNGEANAITRHNAVMAILAQHGISLAEILATTTAHAASFDTFVQLYGDDHAGLINHITAVGIGIQADIQGSTNTIVNAFGDLPGEFTNIVQNAFISWQGEFDDLRDLILSIETCPCQNCSQPQTTNNTYVSSTYVVNNVVNTIVNLPQPQQQSCINGVLGVCGNAGGLNIDVCPILVNLHDVNNSGTIQIGANNVSANNSTIGNIQQNNGC